MSLRSAFMAFVACTAAFAQAPLPLSNLPVPAGIAVRYVSIVGGANVSAQGTPLWGTLPQLAYRNLSFAYNDIVAYVPGPVMLIVEDGIYSHTDQDESFPIFMDKEKIIMGRNAHTVIVEAGSADAFRFNGAPLNNDPGGPFHHGDGPYLQRLTVRNSSAGIRMTHPPGACQLVEPTFEALVMYGNGVAIASEGSSPWIYDCTITKNFTGLDKGLYRDEDCCPWSIVNTICIDNTNYDMKNIHRAEISYSDFDDTKCTLNNIALTVCNYEYPVVNDPAYGRNVKINPVGFVAPTGGATLASGIVAEFDFRLLNGSGGVIGLGTSTGALWDGEGLGNFRDGPIRNRAIDIGADQFNDLRVGPLARGKDPQSLDPAAETVGVAGEHLAFSLSKPANSFAYNIFHKFLNTTLVAPINPPLPAQVWNPLALGSQWVDPFFPATLQMSTFFPAAETFAYPLDDAATAYSPVNPWQGAPLPYSLVVGFWGWGRTTLQFLVINSVIRTTEVQDYRTVFL